MTRRRVKELVEAPTAGRPAVEVIPIDSARFATIAVDDPCWEDPDNTLEYHRGLEGAFVRLRPPATVSDAVLARVVDEVRSVARVARAEAKPRPAIVPATAIADQVLTRPAVSNARVVVLGLVEEAYSVDRPALLAFCEEVMEAVSM